MFATRLCSLSRSLVLAGRHRLLQPSDGRAGRGRCSRRQDPAAAGHGLVARLGLALPDAAGAALDVGLAAELAQVLLALLHLVALRDLPERGAVPGAVLAADAGLLRVLGHLVCWPLGWERFSR